MSSKFDRDAEAIAGSGFHDVALLGRPVDPALEANLRQGYNDLAAQVERLADELDIVRRRFHEDTGLNCKDCALPILVTAYYAASDIEHGPLCKACHLEEQLIELRRQVNEKG